MFVKVADSVGLPLVLTSDVFDSWCAGTSLEIEDIDLAAPFLSAACTINRKHEDPLRKES